MTKYMLPQEQGLRHLLQAAAYSLKGFQAVFSETAFRQALLLLVAGVPLSLWLSQTGTERALLVGNFLLVLAIELLNSALEAAVARIGHEYHPLADRAKTLALPLSL
jgi:diacylglycerol kinase (ATP)